MSPFESLVDTTFHHWPASKRSRLKRSIHAAVAGIGLTKNTWKPEATVARLREVDGITEFQLFAILSILLHEFWKNGEGPAHDAVGKVLHEMEKQATRKK
jgi:hypothetical protein